MVDFISFTIYFDGANTKGLRPDFGSAMPPAEAKALYEQLVEYARQQFANVQTGILPLT